MTETYYRRINNWFIDIRKNMIYGDVVLFPVNYPRFVFGTIKLSTATTVTTSLQCSTYVLTLGPISPEYKKYEKKWQQYLANNKIK